MVRGGQVSKHAGFTYLWLWSGEVRSPRMYGLGTSVYDWGRGPGNSCFGWGWSGLQGSRVQVILDLFTRGQVRVGKVKSSSMYGLGISVK